MKKALRTYTFKDVKVNESLFRKRMEINKSYLRELDDTCLLQNYYFEAGIIIPGLMTVEDPSKANMHWGWEAPSCQLRGFPGSSWHAACPPLGNPGFRS